MKKKIKYFIIRYKITKNKMFKTLSETQPRQIPKIKTLLKDLLKAQNTTWLVLEQKIWI